MMQKKVAFQNKAGYVIGNVTVNSDELDQIPSLINAFF